MATIDHERLDRLFESYRTEPTPMLESSLDDRIIGELLNQPEPISLRQVLTVCLLIGFLTSTVVGVLTIELSDADRPPPLALFHAEAGHRPFVPP